ncbi:hypothetical protein RR48_07396 [Papilio machaon]|uniref:Uncharacterized protein n=1 Tax=Papilio machaon TaxID=76193 RepID=A0A194RQN4_PAPMA|nr:hypothetical protein RR48_07396 [Papilio machaon]
MRRPEDEELGHGDGDEFVDISQMQLVVEAGPSGLQYAGPAPPLAQPAPLSGDTASTASTSVDDLFALYFTPATQDLKRGGTRVHSFVSDWTLSDQRRW